MIDNKTRRKVARFIVTIGIVFFAVTGSVAAQTILVIGDSLSTGYGLSAGEGWVDLLQRQLPETDADANIINDSISGDTTAGGVARLPSALQRIAPDFVIIELGGNDGLRGNSLAAMEQNLRKMIKQTRVADAKPILFGMRLPPNYGEKYTTAFAQVYTTVAAKTETPLLPFFLNGIESNTDFFLPDGIHPNAKAQPIIMQNVAEFLNEIGVLEFSF